MTTDTQLKTARNILKQSKRVVVLSGAGISAESGIPTFRDAQTGLWENYSAQELATVAAFERDPHTVWAWYQWRRELILQNEPNHGHRALAFAANQFERFDLITQNVDGLHQRAGSDNVIEFHGNIFDNFCLKNRHCYGQSIEPTEKNPRRCPLCQSWIRPGVVWFGEGLDPSVMQTSQERVTQCDVLLSVGTSSLVYPAADLAYQAMQQGAKVIEVNIAPTPLSQHCDVILRGSASCYLPKLLAE